MNKFNVQAVYFSPTGGTKRLTEAIAGKFSEQFFAHDLVKNPSVPLVPVHESPLLVVGMPVYSGRIPAVCLPYLEQLNLSPGTPVVALVAYGNRAYEDALVELVDVLQQKKLWVIGAGAFISRHSIFSVVGKGRPDAHDETILNSFVEECHAAAMAGETRDRVLIVKGNHPYRETRPIPLKPHGNRHCIRCGKCATICPMHAIDRAEPKKTDSTRCISCAACIAVCPEKARSFNGLLFWYAQWKFAKKYRARKEPEFFINDGKKHQSI